jgi:biopolymer transport protein ExbB
MLTLMYQGGPLMWVIAALGVIAIIVFLERVLYLRRTHIHAGEFISAIRGHIQQDNFIGAIAACDEAEGPVAQVAKAALLTRDRPRDEIREAVEEAGRTEVTYLERRLVVLATIAQITPLIGFLGTVMGMIQMFRVIQQAALPSPGQLAGGVWTALLTTAAGLVVAVPTYVGYNYLVNRVAQLVLDVEKAATAVMGFVTRPLPPAGNDAPPSNP